MKLYLIFVELILLWRIMSNTDIVLPLAITRFDQFHQHKPHVSVQQTILRHLNYTTLNPQNKMHIYILNLRNLTSCTGHCNLNLALVRGLEL